VTRIAGAVLGVVLLQGALAVPASAQTRRATTRDRFEVSIGALWIGAADLGSTQADLRANNVAPAPFRLFTAETSAAAAPGWDARGGYWLTRSIALEGGIARITPELRTRISGDAEGAAALTATERLDQYFIDGRVVWLLDRFRIRRHTVPFVSGGLGYLRQLHEGRTLVKTGQVYQVGGGLRHQLASAIGWFHAIGIRLDGRVYVLVDGVHLEDSARTHGAITGAVFLTF
jgi:hypothetical protein